MDFEQYALEKFGNGENLGMYESSEDNIWQDAAFSSTVDYDEVNGIDVVGDLSEDLLFTVSTEQAREVIADVPGREYLDPTVEYEVDVGVFNREGETVDEGTATILSGKSYQTSAEVWSDNAVTAALTDGEVDYVEGGVEHSGEGELNFLLNEEPEPTGLDAIDTVQ